MKKTSTSEFKTISIICTGRLEMDW